MEHDFAGLTIDLGALVRNWTALAARAGTARAGAVVKADAYGTGAARAVPALTAAGARDFFVAQAHEGRAIRDLVPADGRIFVMEGIREGDDARGLIAVVNSPEQWFRHQTMRPGAPFAVHIDTGMNRLGFSAGDWAALRAEVLAARPALLMSHLSCADEADHPASRRQLAAFRAATDGTGVARSLAATGGVLLGPDYHFDLIRPGVGLYGAMPFAGAEAVVSLALPVVQIRQIEAGAPVGYGEGWIAPRRARIATLGAGYADGLPRALGGKLRLWAGDRPVPAVGRVSMDAITVDVTDLPDVPPVLEIIGPHQGVDDLAAAAGTIGYEVLTSLGRRFPRRYL
ncbi:MAG: alanine racemase [Paracoccus sp. (in: a-proteobacteria)]|nr:alanine racemase [Paracoccus sp. (in: a-proteobacteria)]